MSPVHCIFLSISFWEKAHTHARDKNNLTIGDIALSKVQWVTKEIVLVVSWQLRAFSQQLGCVLRETLSVFCHRLLCFACKGIQKKLETLCPCFAVGVCCFQFCFVRCLRTTWRNCFFVVFEVFLKTSNMFLSKPVHRVFIVYVLARLKQVWVGGGFNCFPPV